MYRIIWFGRNGGEHIKEADCISKACQCALGERYGFCCIKDSNGNIVYDGIYETDEGKFVFYKRG